MNDIVSISNNQTTALIDHKLFNLRQSLTACSNESEKHAHPAFPSQPVLRQEPHGLLNIAVNCSPVGYLLSLTFISIICAVFSPEIKQSIVSTYKVQPFLKVLLEVEVSQIVEHVGQTYPRSDTILDMLVKASSRTSFKHNEGSIAIICVSL